MANHETKICTKCKSEKPIFAYCRDSTRKDDKHPWCKECRKKQAHQYQKANRDKRREWSANWRARNPEKSLEISRAGHNRNKEKRNAYCVEYRAANLERMREASRQWAKDNLDKCKITNTKRRAVKAQAVPKWVDEEFEQLVISEAYELTKLRKEQTVIDWHVDHIVPLRSKSVCGLHYSANLQVIPGSENMSKGNRVWPNM